ncbi:MULTISPECIES: tyrosine-type recombinase/integrase [Clostridium]|uniref:tyrosine-type recombinase/integrase n=1 Tax=Clostridium TaxID=1485 RepID=UPI00067F32ED|nr:tyrosine-type recombinase/integrase [Clostridium phoceensis]MBS5506379.1 tyrosine-type recombinase/integrase [Oscillospiraceae bacterium]MEE0112994.1 tyrosine-type recombinase/integrase [Eubacteriales bacterium]
MEPRKITEETLAAFARQLGEEERSPATLEKYLREVRQFAAFLGGREVTRELAAAWREELSARQSPATVNGKLTALDRLLAFLGWEDCRVKHLRVQRQLFRDSARELSREEYARLVETARRLGRGRLSLLMETICATGIRVSEVRYITAEAVREGRTEIALKGKIRTILLPGKLCRKLEKYARQKKITSGELFLTRSGRPMSRKQIWAEMKGVCRAAGVAPSKVFPHNLRHLFARCFYRVSRDVAKLADVLGHSSIETTRIYLISTGAEHARTLDQLRLIS